MSPQSDNPLRVDWLPAEYTAPGKLGLTLLPGRSDRSRSLEADLAVLQAEGVTHVVPLIRDEELPFYGVPGLLDTYQKAGLQVRRLPIPDMGVTSQAEMTALVAWLQEVIISGGRVLLHCVGGLGRSGMTAACYLRARGLSTDEAIRTVRITRSPEAVETHAQEKFVADFDGKSAT